MNFTTTSLPLTTTNCTTLNCTTSLTTETTEDTVYLQNTTEKILVTTILPWVLLASLFGNTLLILSISKFKHLRRIESNFFILNLAISDLITTGFGIPVSIVNYHASEFPFGKIGCKLLWPTATYGVNVASFTLIGIAIERFFVICAMKFKLTKRHIFAMIFFIHVAGVCSIIPYSYHLVHEEWEGIYYCYEDWMGSVEQKRYTISLFLLQYGIPLITMIVLYSIAWYTIFKQNRKMIELSEAYERKMHWESEQAQPENNNREKKMTTVSFDENNGKTFTSVEDNSSQQTPVITITTHTEVKIAKTCTLKVEVPNTDENMNQQSYEINNDNESMSPIIPLKEKHSISLRHTFQRSNTIQSIRRTLKKFRKPDYVSHTAYVRHKQTVKTLTMFTIIVIVFLILALPNQIVWLMKDFVPNQPINVYLSIAFNLITYVNPVVNCWIYAIYNKGFRKAYKRLLKTLICRQSKDEYALRRDRFYSQSTQKTETSYYDSEQQQMFEDRSNTFTEMFKQHYDNFEQYKHLYHFEDEENETLLEPPTPSKRKRKLTLANVMNALTPSRKTSVSEKNNKNFSMFPPIVPFVPQREKERSWSNLSMAEMRPRSNTNTSIDMQRQRSNTNLDRSNTLRLPDSSSPAVERHRRSSTPARYSNINLHINSFQRKQRSETEPVEEKNITNSIKDLLTPKLFRKKVVVQQIETSTPVITINDEPELHTRDEVKTTKETLIKIQKSPRKVSVTNFIRKRKLSNSNKRTSPIIQQHSLQSEQPSSIVSLDKQVVNGVQPLALGEYVSLSHIEPQQMFRTASERRAKRRNSTKTNTSQENNTSNPTTTTTTPELKVITINPMEMIVEEHQPEQIINSVKKVKKPIIYTPKPLTVNEVQTIGDENLIPPNKTNSHNNEKQQKTRRRSIKHLNTSKLVAKNKTKFDTDSIELPHDIVVRKNIPKLPNDIVPRKNIPKLNNKQHVNTRSFDNSLSNNSRSKPQRVNAQSFDNSINNSSKHGQSFDSSLHINSRSKRAVLKHPNFTNLSKSIDKLEETLSKERPLLNLNNNDSTKFNTQSNTTPTYSGKINNNDITTSNTQSNTKPVFSRKTSLSAHVNARLFNNTGET